VVSGCFACGFVPPGSQQSQLLLYINTL